MRKIKQTITLYEFDELSQEIKDKIVCEEIDFMIEVDVPEIWDEEGKVVPKHKNSKLYKSCKECERNQTPWFIGEYIFKHMEPEIMARARSREYLKDGDIPKMYDNL